MKIFVSWLISIVVLLGMSPAHVCQAAERSRSAWQPGVFYNVGNEVSFQSSIYKCMYSHTAITGWEPSTVPVLWKRVTGARASARQLAKIDSRSKRVFAPYIHMSETDNKIGDIQKSSGLKHFTFAFIVSGDDCSPAWQGKSPLPLADEDQFSRYVDQVRNSGGDVIISFGGYVGKELAMSCPDAASLAEAYQSVIDKYNAKSLDFDIEASAATDAPSMARRSEALSRLVRANPGLQISFTVPVLPNGMPQSAVDLLKSAKEHNVPVSVVNLMTMDYGTPITEGNMGPLAIVAVEAAIAQLNSLGLDSAIGITPMIGMNDSEGEVFTLADASAVVRYARSSPVVTRLSMWSVGRDRGGCDGTVSPVCSGIHQREWEFTQVFNAFLNEGAK